jgi:protein-S-isoprenylcysteine O-methyltransferase Ste14
MDPINILLGLNVIATFGAHYSGAKKGFRSAVGAAKEKPKSQLQTIPVYLSTLTLIAVILGIFKIGTLEYLPANEILRVIGLLFYLVFSWIQVISVKALGENYSQEIVILKDHKLVTTGMFRIVRHPQYISQILMDLGGAAALLSYIVLPLALIEIPFLIRRAVMEEKLLAKYFKDDFAAYKKKSGFLLPFIG